MTDGVVILGGGASGTLTAVALAALPDVGPLALVDMGGAFAQGVAYSTKEPRHLLNVPAGRMSAIPDQPSHLLSWLAARGETPDPEAFLQRRLYGAYLGELLGATGSRVQRVVDRAVAHAPDGPGLRVDLAGRPALRARAAVLALGNFPPELPPGWTALPPRLAWRTPWASPEDWPAAEAEVLLLGAGLTAVDVVLSLRPSPRSACRPARWRRRSPAGSERQVLDEAPDQGGAERVEGERHQQRHEREVQHGRAIVRHHGTSMRRYPGFASPGPFDDPEQFRPGARTRHHALITFLHPLHCTA
jgi:cation diffusion facilitator CzcD-associated flavoprotein CzcO